MNLLQANAGSSSSKPNYDDLGVIKQDPVKVGDVYEANLYSDEENSFKRKSGRTSDQDVNETARVALQEQNQTAINADLSHKNSDPQMMTPAEVPDEAKVNQINNYTQEDANSAQNTVEYQI